MMPWGLVLPRVMEHVCICDGVQAPQVFLRAVCHDKQSKLVFDSCKTRCVIGKRNQFFASPHHTWKLVICDGVGSLHHREKPVVCDGVFSLRHTSLTNVTVDSPSHVTVARTSPSVTRAPTVKLHCMGWG